MRAKFINEKFTENSDPIKDMEIGNPEKSLFPLFMKELKNFGIEGRWYQSFNMGDGVWEFDLDLSYDDDAIEKSTVQVFYITDEAVKETDEDGWSGGFSIEDNGDLLFPSSKKDDTYDYKKVVKVLLNIKYGGKKNILNKIKDLEEEIKRLKRIEDAL